MSKRNQTITAPLGFRAGSAACGIKVKDKLDVGVVVADVPCAAAAVFTRNQFPGCPVIVGREHMRNGKLRAFVVNSGCSNVATGQRGLKDARAMCRQVADVIDSPMTQVLPSSTGAISTFLPMDKITRGIDKALAALSSSATAGDNFARAIMTTDLKTKQACERIRIGREHVTIAGCCKGSGMIAPNMATMLCFLTTDAKLPAALLNRMLKDAVEPTFNRITVDECPSTSDTVAIMASGTTAAVSGRAHTKTFADALRAVCDSLSYQVVQDGEGATRVLEVMVSGAKTAKDAHTAARAVAVSPLVKTAVHGGDPNWGRIIQALGACSATFNSQKVEVSMGKRDKKGVSQMLLFAHGSPVPRQDRSKLSVLMRQPHVTISIDLGAGRFNDHVLTCDLSREYVAINADYMT